MKWLINKQVPRMSGGGRKKITASVRREIFITTVSPKPFHVRSSVRLWLLFSSPFFKVTLGANSSLSVAQCTSAYVYQNVSSKESKSVCVQTHWWDPRHEVCSLTSRGRNIYVKRPLFVTETGSGRAKNSCDANNVSLETQCVLQCGFRCI